MMNDAENASNSNEEIQVKDSRVPSGLKKKNKAWNAYTVPQFARWLEIISVCEDSEDRIYVALTTDGSCT